MDSYITIKGSATAELIEKKSRFIASVTHVETEEEAIAFLDQIRAENRMARHNVYAYVLRNGRVRYSDDGEPQKTAGLPTLEVIQHAGITDVIVVITRYFGGILLGTGGLVRAYTQATQKGLEAAEKVTISRCIDIELHLEYSLYEQVTRIAQDAQAHIIETAFTNEVTLTVRMLDGTQKAFLTKITELCHGKEKLTITEPFDAPF